MAVVGKNYAVERSWLCTIGFLLVMVGAFVHVLVLPQLQSRLSASGSGRISPASADRASFPSRQEK
jgi:hypothetical protein